MEVNGISQNDNTSIETQSTTSLTDFRADIHTKVQHYVTNTLPESILRLNKLVKRLSPFSKSAFVKQSTYYVPTTDEGTPLQSIVNNNETDSSEIISDHELRQFLMAEIHETTELVKIVKLFLLINFPPVHEKSFENSVQARLVAELSVAQILSTAASEHLSTLHLALRSSVEKDIMQNPAVEDYKVSRDKVDELHRCSLVRWISEFLFLYTVLYDLITKNIDYLDYLKSQPAKRKTKGKRDNNALNSSTGVPRVSPTLSRNNSNLKRRKSNG